MSWMYWTAPTAVFFAAVAAMLVGMTLWELRSPTTARRGLLPIVSTRGDRLFLGLLACAYANLAWVGLTDASPWTGFALSLALLASIFRWG